jgi:hypothetical protein
MYRRLVTLKWTYGSQVRTASIIRVMIIFLMMEAVRIS